MTDYPHDPDHLARTAELLYGLIPEFYKRRDRVADAAAPPESAELRAMVEALAAPLATLRQSIEELYADLFIDTAGAAMLPSLAASIDLDLVFREAEANRRDLASAMARRRRKGTPAMLEEMARALIDRQVATREGWKAAQMTQDLNILRLQRCTPDLRPASVAERAAGPLATLARTLDPRPITARHGHSHPRHMVHWAFLSKLLPLLGAACHALPPGAADLRFAFDAANAWRPLPVRSTGADDQPGTDRVPEGLFAETPGDWHGQDGRFTVRLTGLPAAAARISVLPRAARQGRAPVALAQLPVTLALIETDGARTTGPVEIALLATPLIGDLPDLANALTRREITIDASGITASVAGVGPVVAGMALLLRLRPQAPAASRILGETVLALSGGSPAGLLAATDAFLAISGVRQGVLLLRVPPMRITGDRLFWIGEDGALHDADLSGAIPPLRPLAAGLMPPRALISPPVGPVWPQAAETADRTPFAPALAAPAAAPVPLHGLAVLRSGLLVPVGAGVASALVFALTHFAGLRVFAPMLRLVWTGPDPRTAVWEALDSSAAPLAAAALPARYQTLADIMAQGRADLALAVRFESQRTDALLTMGEVGFTAVDGRSVLIHLPQLAASETATADANGGSVWLRGPAPLVQHSVAVQVGVDGSTWLAGSNILMRRSLGQTAPLPGPVFMQRRQVGWRRLCPWQNEGAGGVLDPTLPGRLDIDPRFGLFALCTADGIVPHPNGPTLPPPPVTVDMQVGATLEIGALPLDFDRILNRAPRQPTRLVSASGHLGRGADPALLSRPLHRSLDAALIAAAASGLAAEVIRVVDSGYYAAQTLTWPIGPTHLIIEAATGQRPMVEVAASVPGAAGYDHLELSGLALLPQGGAAMTLALPPAQRAELAFLSVLTPALRLSVTLREAAGLERLTIRRSVLGPLLLADPGDITITDSVLDAGAEAAVVLDATRARLTMDRATVIGRVEIGETVISDAILAGQVFARERFRGCIRFSLLAPGGETPRKHRVLRRDPATGATIRAPFLSRDRRDPAYLRLDPAGDPRLLTWASDGGEVGAFNAARLGELLAGLARRLAEHTPAGLLTGVVPRS